jgi:hypothetical protein
MLVMVTPAKPQSPVEDLSYLAQDALDTTRVMQEQSVDGSAFTATRWPKRGSARRRGAHVALTAMTEQEAGPAPAILSLELRTVSLGTRA